MQTAKEPSSSKESTRLPASTASTAPSLGTGGSPTEQGASRGPRGLREYNLRKGLGIIGQPHRDLRPQGAATQSTGTGCIVHPTQVHAFAVRASYPRALSRSLYTVPWDSWEVVQTNRPTVWGDQGWNFIADSEAVFSSLKSLRSIHPGYSPLPGSREQLLRSVLLPLLSPSLFLSPSAGQAFLPPLPCDLFFFSTPGPSPAAPHLFQVTPHLTLTLTSQSNNFKSWTGHLSICWVATLSHQSGLDPRPSILETL